MFITADKEYRQREALGPGLTNNVTQNDLCHKAQVALQHS